MKRYLLFALPLFLSGCVPAWIAPNTEYSAVYLVVAIFTTVATLAACMFFIGFILTALNDGWPSQWKFTWRAEKKFQAFEPYGGIFRIIAVMTGAGTTTYRIERLYRFAWMPRWQDEGEAYTEKTGAEDYISQELKHVTILKSVVVPDAKE